MAISGVITTKEVLRHGAVIVLRRDPAAEADHLPELRLRAVLNPDAV